jgi:hypothetical protein
VPSAAGIALIALLLSAAMVVPPDGDAIAAPLAPDHLLAADVHR